MWKVCVLLLMCIKGFAGQIHSFAELKEAVLQGERFVIVFELPKMAGSFAPKALMWVAASDKGPEHVATSDLHFSDHTGAPLYEYVRYTFGVDGGVTLKCAMYQPQNFEVVGKVHTIQGMIGQEVKVYSR